MLEPGKHQAGNAWGPREIIALVVIGGSFLLAGTALVLDRPGATIPAWVAALVGGVAFYLYKNGSIERR